MADNTGANVSDRKYENLLRTCINCIFFHRVAGVRALSVRNLRVISVHSVRAGERTVRTS